MEFHGVDMEGYFKAKTVLDASALVWGASDEGKIVYDQTTKDLWIADDSDWKNSNKYGDIPAGTEMWFYENSQPAGWTITAAGDALLAVKSTAGTYSTGGTTGGGWATPAHSHTLGTHGHVISGTTGAPSQEVGGKADGADVVSDDNHTHVISIWSNTANPDITSIDGSSSAYRPISRVGLICSRNA